MNLLGSFETDHSEAILCLFMIDDTYLATGSADNSIKIWNIKENILDKTLKYEAGVHTLRTFNCDLN